MQESSVLYNRAPVERHCEVELSVIVTSNLPFSQCSTAFADDQTLTAALLDRLLHYAHIVQISGNSYRLKGKKSAGKPPLPNKLNNDKHQDGSNLDCRFYLISGSDFNCC